METEPQASVTHVIQAKAGLGKFKEGGVAFAEKVRRPAEGPWDPALRELRQLTTELEGLRAESGPVEGRKPMERGWGQGRGTCRRQQAQAGSHPQP